MKQYETMYIIKSNLDDEARTALVEEMHNIIKNHNGTIDNVNEMGMKDFAYEIDGMTKGYYVVVNYTVDVAGLNEFSRLLRLNGDVVRSLTISEDEKKSGK